ncbi:MAG: hypothetical protein ACLQM6_01975 [Acidobacteriaceae bacterium]
MTQYRFIPVVFLSAAMAMPALAASGRVPITVDQVAAAINSAGMKVSAGQVVLLTDVVATSSAPQLKVESIERWGDHRMKFRLNCVKSEECLPFFVAVQWSQEEATPPEFADHSSTAISLAKPGSSSYTLRAGSPAVLLLEGDHIHIQLPVVCLENGAIGQTIRVTSPDHRQTYTAEVGDGAVLRGKQ